MNSYFTLSKFLDFLLSLFQMPWYFLGWLRRHKRLLAGLHLWIDSALHHHHNVNGGLQSLLSWTVFLYQVGYGQFFYCIFVFLYQVGYGHIAPATTSGRLFCILYSLIGIPLLLVFMSQVQKLYLCFFASVFSLFFHLLHLLLSHHHSSSPCFFFVAL